jgi:hypothetical protein
MARKEVNEVSEHEEQEERPSETEPNPTQERIDELDDTDKPVDVEWEKSSGSE